VVADEQVTAMMRQGDAATGTAHDMAAIPAHHKGGRPATVEEQNGLLVTIEHALQSPPQLARKHGTIPRPQLLPHVDNLHRR